MNSRRAAEGIVTLGLLAHALFASISIAGMQISLGVAAAGLAMAAAGGFRLRRSPLDAPIAALVLVCIASDLLSPYRPPALEYATLWRSALGFYVVFHGLSVAPPRTAERMVLCACAGLCASALVGLVQYRTGIDVVHQLGLRGVPASVEAPGLPGRFGAMGFFTSRLTFGNNAAVLLGLIGGGLSSPELPRGGRWLAGAAVALGLAAVVATFDRAAWLGLAAAALVLVAMGKPRTRPILGAAALAALLIAALHPGVRARFSTSFDVSRNADRVFLWQRAGEIIRDHPLLGIGFANYPRVGPIYYDRVDPAFPMRTWAHNLELSLLAETGPLGLAAFLWLVAAAGRALSSAARAGAPFATGAAAAGIALLVIGQVHDVLYDTKVMYPLWMALGLALAPSSRASRAAAPTASIGS